MAQLPQFKEFKKEDYKESPEWFTRFLYLLNNFTNAVYVALNKALTFTENIRCQIKDLDLTTPADYTSGGFPAITFTSSLNVKPTGLWIIQATTANFLPIINVGGQVANWLEANNIVTINYISGLENSKSYKVKVVVI